MGLMYTVFLGKKKPLLGEPNVQKAEHYVRAPNCVENLKKTCKIEFGMGL